MITSLVAELTTQPLTPTVIQSALPIVDIRTVGEWKDTGVVKNSILIEFYDERGRYDLKGFLDTLNKKVDTSKEYGILCHSGSRSRVLSGFLSQELGHKVVDFSGGIDSATKKYKIILEKYQ
jgi:rhodanese-related sulfurtransferase